MWRRVRWERVYNRVTTESESAPLLSSRCRVLPLPFSTNGSVSEWSIIGDCGNVIPDGAGSQIRMLWSSEHDANMRSFVGFQATELTLPSPWPVSTSRRAPVSRCHMYTFPSKGVYQDTWALEKKTHDGIAFMLSPSLPLTTKLPSIPPKQLRMTWRPWLWPEYLRAIRPVWISQR